MTDTPKTLENRDGLPDALRILIEQYPRDLWEGHSNFDGMTRFWLSRHLEFRRALKMMQDDAQALLGKGDTERLTNRLAHVGRFFVEALHGHHHIEDHHYFPIFIQTEPRLAAGFEILDKDHHTLHAHLDTLEGMIGALAQPRAVAEDNSRMFGRLEQVLGDFDRFMDRHLIDEEDLIVPIVLKYGPIHP